MDFIDFIIGLTLVNTIPHFVLGIWKGRMISGLGFGITANILYGILNFIISISLFHNRFGIAGLLENVIYLVGKLCYNYFQKYAKKHN